VKWTKVGDSAADGYNRRVFATEIPRVGCIVLINSEANGGRITDHTVFVPGVQIKDKCLVPIDLLEDQTKKLS
jgi:hypothetical protein